MTLYESLLKQYGANEPIFSADIKFQSYSRPWILLQLKRLCAEGKLIRYEKGVYYIPTETPFGKSVLNPIKVIEKKYIRKGDEVIGYYSGLTLQNMLKLSTQMANVIEIYTNNETSNVRDVMVGKQKVLLRRARTPIKKENVAILSFLELMNDIAPRSLDAEKKDRIAEYMACNAITKEAIISYAAFFPDKVMRNLIESEAIFNVTRG